MTEYEVLKRHDVYVVRKVGAQEYATRCYEWVGRRIVGWWSYGSSEDAHEFRFKWRAILHAKSLEREAKRAKKYDAMINARKSATEERVWR
mgnify:CR=1 FL=1